MMYRVIKRFADLEDKKHVYCVGDEYPRSGQKTTEKRLKELLSDSNKIGVPLIEKVKDNEHDDGALPKSQKLVRQRSKKVARKNNNQ